MSHAHLDSDIFRNIPRPGEMESNNMYHVFLCLYLKKKSLGLFCPQVNHDQVETAILQLDFLRVDNGKLIISPRVSIVLSKQEYYEIVF